MWYESGIDEYQQKSFDFIYFGSHWQASKWKKVNLGKGRRETSHRVFKISCHDVFNYTAKKFCHLRFRNS